MRRGAFAGYRALLAQPGAAPFVAAAFLGRFAKAGTALSALLLVAFSSGSYGFGGAVSGTIALCIAIGGPQWARAVDRFGQHRVLPWAALALTLSGAAFLALVTTGAPVPLWFAAAALVGLSVCDTGSLARSRWVHLIDARGASVQRGTAFALESVADELAFVLGPPLVTILAAVVHPGAGMVVAGLLAVAGWLMLTRLRGTEPPPSPRRERGAPPTHGRWQGVGVALGVAVVFAGIGSVFGSFDVTAVSLTESWGVAPLGGVAIGVFAIGSVAAAVVVGTVRAGGVVRRFVVLGIAYGLVVPLVLLAVDVPTLLLFALGCGLVTSPLLVTGMSLVESRSPRERLTELMTWPSAGISVGVTAGAALGGQLVDTAGADAGHLVTAIGAVLVLLSALGVALAASRRPSAPAPGPTPVAGG